MIPSLHNVTLSPSSSGFTLSLGALWEQGTEKEDPKSRERHSKAQSGFKSHWSWSRKSKVGGLWMYPQISLGTSVLLAL
jgi:hypothetical protein